MPAEGRPQRAHLPFEREALSHGVAFQRTITGHPGRLTYRVPIDAPVYDDRRVLTIALTRAWDPEVKIDGPVCLQHRNSDGSLCLWWDRDRPERVWVPADGLLGLVNLAITHAFCEERCRRGFEWPRPEAPGHHRRTCRTCRPR
jgi:hypothetical protein